MLLKLLFLPLELVLDDSSVEVVVLVHQLFQGCCFIWLLSILLVVFYVLGKQVVLLVEMVNILVLDDNLRLSRFLGQLFTGHPRRCLLFTF